MPRLEEISAQELLTLQEMRRIVRGQRVHAVVPDLATRADRAADWLGVEGIQLTSSTGGASIADMCTEGELWRMAAGWVPPDMPERLWRVEAISWCVNCDGVQCMSCVAREVHDACAADCPHCSPAL